MTKILLHIDKQSRERQRRAKALEALKLSLGRNTSGAMRSNARMTLSGQCRLKVFPVMGQKNMACGW